MILKSFDEEVAAEIIQQRQRLGIDRKDEAWDGMYVIMPEPTNAHQDLVGNLVWILKSVVDAEGVGRTHPGANVSDRRKGWKKNFRAPDVVVVLPGSQAVDCNTHWMGGPDFLVEIQSPGDETDAKIPFYSGIGVRELLIIHRDTRQLRLFRHDGTDLAPIDPSDFQGKKWLRSATVPLAFRRTTPKGQGPRTEVRRTDDTPGQWVI
jgi:Uma2 family endonuclease